MRQTIKYHTDRVSRARRELREADRVVTEARRKLNVALGKQSNRQRAVDEAHRALAEARLIGGGG